MNYGKEVKEKEVKESVVDKARSTISYMACRLKGHDLNGRYCRTCKRQH